MDWKVIIFLILLLVTAIGFITLGVLLACERRKRRRAEAERDQMEGAVRRLLNERENKELSNEDAAKKLSDIMSRWSPDDPPGVSGTGTGQ